MSPTDGSTGDAQTEVVEQTDTPRPDQVAAGLVATEAGLVDEADPRATPGEHDGRDAASRTGSHDDHVVTCSRQGHSPN